MTHVTFSIGSIPRNLENSYFDELRTLLSIIPCDKFLLLLMNFA